jgi:hypothetical protein
MNVHHDKHITIILRFGVTQAGKDRRNISLVSKQNFDPIFVK